MANEDLKLPSREEWEEYVGGLDDTFNKVKTAGLVSVGFLATSVVFPPAAVGAVVSMGEMGRQAV